MILMIKKTFAISSEIISERAWVFLDRNKKRHTPWCPIHKQITLINWFFQQQIMNPHWTCLSSPFESHSDPMCESSVTESTLFH